MNIAGSFQKDSHKSQELNTERIQNGYENVNGTGIEWKQNGYRTDIERIRNSDGSQKL